MLLVKGCLPVLSPIQFSIQSSCVRSTTGCRSAFDRWKRGYLSQYALCCNFQPVAANEAPLTTMSHQSLQSDPGSRNRTLHSIFTRTASINKSSRLEVCKGHSDQQILSAVNWQGPLGSTNPVNCILFLTTIFLA